MELRVRRVMFAMGDRDRAIIGRIRPFAVSPLAGNQPSFTDSISTISEPMIKDGMEMKAVVSTMMILSASLLRCKAATAPSTTPNAMAITAANRPSLAEVRIPSTMTSMTMRPRSLMEGPKSNFVTISLR